MKQNYEVMKSLNEMKILSVKELNSPLIGIYIGIIQVGPHYMAFVIESGGNQHAIKQCTDLNMKMCPVKFGSRITLKFDKSVKTAFRNDAYKVILINHDAKVPSSTSSNNPPPINLENFRIKY